MRRKSVEISVTKVTIHKGEEDSDDSEKHKPKKGDEKKSGPPKITDKRGLVGFIKWMELVKKKQRMTMQKEMKVVDKEELLKHQKDDDFWTVFKGNVYDITNFLKYHPGGIKILDKYKGNDMTKDFFKCHHWVNGDSSLENVYIGKYKPS